MWIHPIPSKFSLGLNQLCSHHIHCNWWDQPPEILFLFLTCKWTHVAKKWLFSALLHPTPRPCLLENKIRVTLSLGQSMWSLAEVPPALMNEVMRGQIRFQRHRYVTSELQFFFTVLLKSWNEEPGPAKARLRQRQSVNRRDNRCKENPFWALNCS